jgi:hypothetical protein
VTDHPRPLLRRAEWLSLDGLWNFALDPRRQVASARGRRLRRAHRGAVRAGDTRQWHRVHGLVPAFWYRAADSICRSPRPASAGLHFGAVDHEATVWIRRSRRGAPQRRLRGLLRSTSARSRRTAARSPWSRARFDDPADLAKPRGKQEWRDAPHSILLPAHVRLWRTVWAERVPFVSNRRLGLGAADFERFELALDVALDGRCEPDWRLAVRVRRRGPRAGRRRLAHRGRRSGGAAHSAADGFDERNELCWSPEWPRLLDVGAAPPRRREPGRSTTVLGYAALRRGALRARPLHAERPPDLPALSRSIRANWPRPA